jgi:hypothetical protein
MLNSETQFFPSQLLFCRPPDSVAPGAGAPITPLPTSYAPEYSLGTFGVNRLSACYMDH